MTKRQELEETCREAGITFDTYSPGDGVTRYKFFREPGSGYFGPHDGFHTSLGLSEALTFAEGYLLGRAARDKLKEKEIEVKSHLHVRDAKREETD